MKMPKRSLLIRPSCSLANPVVHPMGRASRVGNWPSARQALGEAAACRRGSPPTAPRRTNWRALGRTPGSPSKAPRRTAITSPLSGSEAKTAEPQSPQSPWPGRPRAAAAHVLLAADHPHDPGAARAEAAAAVPERCWQRVQCSTARPAAAHRSRAHSAAAAPAGDGEVDVWARLDATGCGPVYHKVGSALQRRMTIRPAPPRGPPHSR